VFTSSNCIFARPAEDPLPEEAEPAPIEIYGKSKLEGEKILIKHGDLLPYTIIRCPTIVSSGRLGLLAILFEFIRENRKIPVVGDGSNRYQFIYASDLAEAMFLDGRKEGCQIYNIGSDNVRPLREVYEDVIRVAGSKSRVYSLPKGPTIAALKLAHFLRISPLGPYHYRMISESFIFDTSRIKKELGWKPTRTNSEMLADAYRYYVENYEKIQRSENLPAHRKGAKMGIIKLLKWLS